MPHWSCDAGRRVALLTQHGKEGVVAAVLEPVLSCVIEHVTGFDTDQLGTFTGETPRAGTQLDAARRKARKGMELSGLSVGIGSEGSFGPDPFSGMFPWNVELLVWIDDDLGMEIVGCAQGAARSGHIQSGDWHEVLEFAQRAGFPEHQLVLRPDGPSEPPIRKGIADRSGLRSGFDAGLNLSRNRQVFVEMDLRAFANPTRMRLIEQAATDLLRRIQSACPACGAPGFWVTQRLRGLPCAACRWPTATHRREVWACLRCDRRQALERTDLLAADPAQCARCNP